MQLLFVQSISPLLIFGRRIVIILEIGVLLFRTQGDLWRDFNWYHWGRVKCDGEHNDCSVVMPITSKINTTAANHKTIKELSCLGFTFDTVVVCIVIDDNIRALNAITSLTWKQRISIINVRWRFGWLIEDPQTSDLKIWITNALYIFQINITSRNHRGGDLYKHIQYKSR